MTGKYSSELFKRNIESELGEPIEDIMARPLPNTDAEDPNYRKSTQLVVGMPNKKGRFTKNIIDIFPDTEVAFQGAIRPKWYERVINYFRR